MKVHHFRVDVQQNHSLKHRAGKSDREKLNYETTNLPQANLETLAVLQVRQALDNLYKHHGDVFEDSLPMSAPLPGSADLPLDRYVKTSIGSVSSCSCLALSSRR